MLSSSFKPSQHWHQQKGADHKKVSEFSTSFLVYFDTSQKQSYSTEKLWNAINLPQLWKTVFMFG